MKNSYLVPAISRELAVRRGIQGQADSVPHLGIAEVRRLIDAVRHNRHGERDTLLIQTLFDGCLRCSEATGIRPQDIQRSLTGWEVRIFGKGGKWDLAAISASLAAQLQAYAYQHNIPKDARIFPLHRSRVFQIIRAAMEKSGLTKVEGVGTVHILRHSGAIERLRQTRNPKAVQDQLRHKSMLMTMRYMKTLSQEESLAIQQQVDFQW